MLTAAPKGFHCLDAEKNCNPCLDAAKACNLNGSCKRQRSAYIATCSKEDPNKGEPCSRKRCHKALRLFLDRVPPEFSHRLLFCPCQSEGCAERRRQTIVPDCSYKDKEKPNCLELRRVCRQDSLCRWSKGKWWWEGSKGLEREMTALCVQNVRETYFAFMHVCVCLFGLIDKVQRWAPAKHICHHHLVTYMRNKKKEKLKHCIQESSW